MNDFKDIKGFEGKYQVSSNGEVRNRHGHILIPCETKKGYQKIGLFKNRTRKNCYIHRLVAETFIPNNENLPQINHKDGNKKNNTVENLEWCTAKENVKHSVDTCLRTKLKAVDMYLLNGQFVCTFQTISMAAKETGVASGHISSCCKGKYGYKTAGGYVWKYHKGGVISNVLHG